MDPNVAVIMTTTSGTLSGKTYAPNVSEVPPRNSRRDVTQATGPARESQAQAQLPELGESGGDVGPRVQLDERVHQRVAPATRLTVDTAAA